MSLSENLGLVYFLIPFLFVIKNKINFILQVILNKTNYKIKLNNFTLKINASQFDTILSLLATLTYSTFYEISSDGKLVLNFGKRSRFIVNLNNLTFEDGNLLQTLFGGLRHGANFVTNDEDFQNHRDKTFKITEEKGKKIIETSEGIKFYMDSIHPGNTIAQTFVRKNHLLSSKDNWNGKVVVDIGAECGDTPLYYANLGAKVYAFEPIKAHYDAMIRNMSLNPEISKNIIPINAAIGKDEILTFYQNTRNEIAEMASYVYNVHGKNVKTVKVQGYSFETVLKKFNINHVDLFKIDCKGCEFSLTKEALTNVERVKISNTYDTNPERSQEKLIDLLEDAGFKCVIYRSNPNRDRASLRYAAQIYGIKAIE